MYTQLQGLTRDFKLTLRTSRLYAYLPRTTPTREYVFATTMPPIRQELLPLVHRAQSRALFISKEVVENWGHLVGSNDYYTTLVNNQARFIWTVPSSVFNPDTLARDSLTLLWISEEQYVRDYLDRFEQTHKDTHVLVQSLGLV